MENKEVSEFYDDFADHQSELGINKRHRSIMKFLGEHGLQPEHKVLEIGAGIGTLTQLLAEYLPNGELTMNDISHRSVEIAKKTLNIFNNITYLAGDILEHNIATGFDAVIFPDVLEHIPVKKHAEIFRRCDSLLNYDGAIYIHIPSPFYIDWLKINDPGSMQVIDQAIHLQDFLKNIVGTSFYVHFMQQYSLFVEGDDYRFLVFRKKRAMDFKVKNDPGVRFHKRMMSRFQLATKILLKGSDERS